MSVKGGDRREEEAQEEVRPLRVISYGGGVQSTALLVLAVQGRLGKVDAALFANVGDDSEHPETLRYVRSVAGPFGGAHGVPVVELHRTKRTGEIETLYGRLTKVGGKQLPIPVRMDNGRPGRRSCTRDFKIQVLGRWLKANGASRSNPAEVCIGISLDEMARLKNGFEAPYERILYPLIDLRLTREACKRIIERAGLRVPPKSACYFCPFHRPSMWARMRRDEPDLFEKSASLEDMLNARRLPIGKDPVWLTRFAAPLRQAIVEEQEGIDFGTGPGAESCDEGYCWT